MDQNVEAAEPVKGRLDDVVGSSARADVRLNELLGVGVRGYASCDSEHDASAASHPIYDGGANPLAAARNEDSLAGEFVCVEWDFGNVHSMCTSRSKII